jgi:hypothetical protein
MTKPRPFDGLGQHASNPLNPPYQGEVQGEGDLIKLFVFRIIVSIYPN